MAISKQMVANQKACFGFRRLAGRTPLPPLKGVLWVFKSIPSTIIVIIIDHVDGHMDKDRADHGQEKMAQMEIAFIGSNGCSQGDH